MRFFDKNGKEAECLGCQGMVPKFPVIGILLKGFLNDGEKVFTLLERFFCHHHRAFSTPNLHNFGEIHNADPHGVLLDLKEIRK